MTLPSWLSFVGLSGIRYPPLGLPTTSSLFFCAHLRCSCFGGEVSGQGKELHHDWPRPRLLQTEHMYFCTVRLPLGVADQAGLISDVPVQFHGEGHGSQHGGHF